MPSSDNSSSNVLRHFYAGSHAFILVYSVNYPVSFKSLDHIMNNIDQFCNNENVLRFLVGHRCDLHQERRVKFDDLLDKCEEYKCKGFETSICLEYRGTIDDLFKEVIE